MQIVKCFGNLQLVERVVKMVGRERVRERRVGKPLPLFFPVVNGVFICRLHRGVVLHVRNVDD